MRTAHRFSFIHRGVSAQTVTVTVPVSMGVDAKRAAARQYEEAQKSSRVALNNFRAPQPEYRRAPPEVVLVTTGSGTLP